MKDLKRYFAKEAISMASKHIGRRLNVTGYYHEITTMYLLRMSKITRTVISVAEDVEEPELSYTVDGNVKWHNHSGKQLGTLS